MPLRLLGTDSDTRARAQEASDQAAAGAEAEIADVWERHAAAQQALHATLAQLDSASAQARSARLTPPSSPGSLLLRQPQATAVRGLWPGRPAWALTRSGTSR